MSWVGGVWLSAAAAAIGAMLMANGVFGIGWYALALGLPIFLTVSVAMPLILGVLDRQKLARDKDAHRQRRNLSAYPRPARDER